MKVKRTCLQCGAVWYSEKGIFGDLTVGDVFFTGFFSSVLKGSFIDISYSQQQIRKAKRRCPNCNSEIFTEIAVAEQEKVDHPKQNEESITKEIEESNLNGNKVFYLSVFLGWFGIDRFYAKKTGSGFLKLVTFGCGGIWWLMDIIFILTDQFKDASGNIIKMQGNKSIRAAASLVLFAVSSFLFMLSIFFLLTKERDNAAFEKAKSFLQNSEYEQALQELNTISKGYEKYSTVEAWKRELEPKIDSLQKEQGKKNYELGGKLFNEGKYNEALLVLEKINNKYKEYNKVDNMIKAAKMAQTSFALTNFMNDKTSVNGTIKKDTNYSKLDVSGKVQILSMAIVWFASIAKNIKECEGFQNLELEYLDTDKKNKLKNECKKIASQAKNKLKNDQRRDFPLLRKEYAKLMDELLWKNNVEVKAAGSGNSRLEFTSGIFANNANIDDFQKKVLVETKVKDNIKFFRFKSIAYKWYEHDNNYTYYEYNTPADDVEISINE